MNRRGFLQMLGVSVGGIAVEQAIPFNRVWSFPKNIIIPQPASVRFLQAWDIYESRLIQRVDIAFGLDLPLPGGLQMAEVITVPHKTDVQNAIDMLSSKYKFQKFSMDSMASHIRPGTSCLQLTVTPAELSS